MVAHANLEPFPFKQGLLGAYQTLYVPERELQVDYESARGLASTLLHKRPVPILCHYRRPISCV